MVMYETKRLERIYSEAARTTTCSHLRRLEPVIVNISVIHWKNGGDEKKVGEAKPPITGRALDSLSREL
jgi:hypothetical protein